MAKKKNHKWKTICLSVLGLLVLAVGTLAYGYYQLQPKNHFTSVPVVSSGKNAANETVNVKEPIFNVLLIGSDERKGQNIGHSDTMMLVHVDLNKHKYNAMSIPRDTRVHVDGYGYTKLTSVQYIMQAKNGSKQGVEAAVSAVSELTGVPINYYVETNFEGFQSMVDSMDGITMDVPFDVALTKDNVIKAGTHSFNGTSLIRLVRERHSLDNGDFGRQRLQMEALKGIAEKALNPGNITKLPALVKTVPDYIIATNMTTSDMMSFGMAAKDFKPDSQLSYFQIPGKGQKLYDDILEATNYQLVIDAQKIKKLAEAHFKL